MNNIVLKIFFGLMISITSAYSFAQFSNERIAIGTLKGMDRHYSGQIEDYKYSINFYKNSRRLLVLDLFIFRPNQKVPFFDYEQRFEFTEENINASFPKIGDDIRKFKSKDGYIYLVTNENIPAPINNKYNLVFIEFNNKKEFRLSYHRSVSEGYLANGLFTQEHYDRNDPLGPTHVFTTEWFDTNY